MKRQPSGVVAPGQDPAMRLHVPPRVRAAEAWTALKISPTLESLALLAGGLHPRPPHEASGPACPLHVVGPLVASLVGPVAGPFPADSVEEFFPRALHARRATRADWQRWQSTRRAPLLAHDLTLLMVTGSCADIDDVLACTCRDGQPEREIHLRWSLGEQSDVLSALPWIVPDPSGADPWHDALVVLAQTYRGPGSPLVRDRPPTVAQARGLVQHLERLSHAFAGRRRVDRMAGLAHMRWCPPLEQTPASRECEQHAWTEKSRVGLLARLRTAVGVDLRERVAVPVH